MNFRKFRLKIKAFVRKKKKGGQLSRNLVKKASWMTPVTHGYRIVEDPIGKTPNITDYIDSVVVQREQIQDQELWFFGVFSSNVVSDQVTRYLRTNLFDGNQKEVLRKRSKEVLRKAHMNARTTTKEKDDKQRKRTCEMNGASAIVINGEKLIIACMGEYRAVVCRDGKAFPVSNKKRHQDVTKSHWSKKFIPGFLVRRSGEGMNSHNTSTEKKLLFATTSSKPQLHVASETIDQDTEFVILGSNGIWEVMKDQEAVNLISHFGDPQMAAECITNEAITRTSRSKISCLVIRFDHFS